MAVRNTSVFIIRAVRRLRSSRLLGQGVSQWEITGGYTGQSHTMLMCTIQRPQVNNVKSLVAQTDPDAFLIVGNAHQALGAGFTPLK